MNDLIYIKTKQNNKTIILKNIFDFKLCIDFFL